MIALATFLEALGTAPPNVHPRAPFVGPLGEAMAKAWFEAVPFHASGQRWVAWSSAKRGHWRLSPEDGPYYWQPEPLSLPGGLRFVAALLEGVPRIAECEAAGAAVLRRALALACGLDPTLGVICEATKDGLVVEAAGRQRALVAPTCTGRTAVEEIAGVLYAQAAHHQRLADPMPWPLHAPAPGVR